MCIRDSAYNMKPLLTYAKVASDENTASAAIEAAHKSAIGQPAGGFIKDFLNLIKDAPSPAIRTAAERAVTDIISQASNKDQFSGPLTSAYEEAFTNEARYAMLRLSGTIGGNQNSALIKAALDSDDDSLTSAAITALSQWKDTSELNTLIEFTSKSNNQTLRKRAFESAYSFLQKQKDSDGIEKFWEDLAEAAYSRREKLQLIGGLTKQNKPWAITILDKFTNSSDNKVAEQAQRAKDQLENR